jgi:phosphatidylserine decarboxylase
MIDSEGVPFVLIPLCAGATLLIVGFAMLGWPLVVLAVGALLFFRSPPRRCSEDAWFVCSPTDGRVTEVGPLLDPVPGLQLSQRLCVAPGVMDVHIVRAAIEGTVAAVEARARRGRRDGRQPRPVAFELWQGPAGVVGVRYPGGLLSRRRGPAPAVGEAVARGQRVGVIGLGGRVEVLLDDDAQMLVKPGDRLRAGETPIARRRGQP